LKTPEVLRDAVRVGPILQEGFDPNRKELGNTSNPRSFGGGTKAPLAEKGGRGRARWRSEAGKGCCLHLTSHT